MLFVEIYAKNVKFGYLNPILGKLGVTHDLIDGSLESPCGFLSALIELSSLSVTVPELSVEMCTARSAVFAGVDLFALKFYLDRVVSQQPFLASEN